MAINLLFQQLFDYETWTYTYLLADRKSGGAILIDTVKEQVPRDLKLLEELDLQLKYILETHVHADHVTGAFGLREVTGAKICMSAAAKLDCADLALVDGQKLSFGPIQIQAIATPGHTNGCMSFFCEGMVFTGDSLFIRDVGRTDFQVGSNAEMYKTITQKLFTLPGETRVYPGHDYHGRLFSTIEEERKFNSKLGGGKTETEFTELMLQMKLGEPKRLHVAIPANMHCGKME